MNNAVLDGRGRVCGYLCHECGETFQSMLGETCNGCRAKERRHREMLAAMKKPASFEVRVKLMQVVIGMAKEAGYDMDDFIDAVRTGWPHV